MRTLQRLSSITLALVLVLSQLAVPQRTAVALSSGIVISQIYGAGGVTGAIYTNDYVELFNRGASTVDLAGWSIQYASATGTGFFVATPIASGSVASGKYFLVQMAGGVTGAIMPSPDAIGTTNMSGTNGKVIVANIATSLACNGFSTACTPAQQAQIVDLVGYGSANYFEGAAAPAASPSNSIFRGASGCTETDNNSTDFAAGVPAPRNSTTAAHGCGPVVTSLSIDNRAVTEGNSGTITASFTVSLSSPAPVGGVSFDIVTADGTATTADGDYLGIASATQTIAAGDSNYTYNVTVNGDTTTEPDETFFVNITNVSGAIVSDAQSQGTIINDDAVLPVLSVNDVTVVEGNTGTTTATFTVSLSTPALPAGVSFDIATADGTATAPGDYLGNSVIGQTIAEGGLTSTFDVTVNGDTSLEATETFFVNITNLFGASVGDAQGLGSITNDELTPIYTIQGSGPATTVTGVVITQGIVVGDYEGASGLSGFYIQDVTGDGDPLTSDGIFVYKPITNLVSVGDTVSVAGTSGENQGQTQIGSVTNITVLSSGNTLPPTDIALPFVSATFAEQYEGMLVRVPQQMFVTEIYLLGRIGQVTLASERLPQPTNFTTPGAPAIAMRNANILKSIILDDELNSQNPDPIKFGRGGLPLSASNTLRGGDSISNVVGVLTYTWGGNSVSPNAYRIRPINALGGGAPNFTASNPRPAGAPALVSGSTLRAAGMNLLNYFNTFNNPGFNCTGGINSSTPIDCRGANSPAEFERQAVKTVAAIIGSNADVVGIAEMENDGYGVNSAIADLVNRLNLATAPGTYAFVDADADTGVSDVLGSDAIKVGFIYKPARVSKLGVAALNSVAFVNGGETSARNRPALAATFQQADGERVTLVINHFKSKSGGCTSSPDTGDGQGACNLVRVNASVELDTWLKTDPTVSSDPDFLILGDLNSYAREDPITTLETAGYTNLISAFNGPLAYSYAFDGQWGTLDHALGTNSLFNQTLGVQDWHINSDEPSVLDYNTEFKSVGQQSGLYATGEFRMSDHDPVLVDLKLIPATFTISGNAGTPGASITYTGGSTLADALTGAYSFSVVSGWTGSITPSRTGYGFTPISITISTAVMVDLPNQDFAAHPKVTIGVFRTGSAFSYLRNTNDTGFADIAFRYGIPGDLPVFGDWDGNLSDTAGVYRNGVFYLRNSNDKGVGVIIVPFGQPGDLPVAGDWDGNGSDTIGVYRNGVFYLRNNNSPGPANFVIAFGQSSDTPIVGDWNGDGTDTIGVYRRSIARFFLRNTNGNGSADIVTNYGIAGDKPVAGDWDGNGSDSIGVYRNNGFFYLANSNTVSFADFKFAYGLPTDIPLAGTWKASLP